MPGINLIISSQKSLGSHTQASRVQEFKLFICCTLLCLGVKIPYSHNKALQPSVPQLMLSCALRLRKLMSTFQRRIIVLVADVSMHITGGFKGFSFKTTTKLKHTGDYGMFVETIQFVTSVHSSLTAHYQQCHHTSWQWSARLEFHFGVQSGTHGTHLPEIKTIFITSFNRNFTFDTRSKIAFQA